MPGHRPLLLLLSSLLPFLGACGGSSGSSSALIVRTTSAAATGSAPMVVRGRWLVYFASEQFTGPGGTDFNGDTDTLDSIASVVDLAASTETRLDVAALGAEVLGDEIYLVVDESEDGTDWSGTNGTADVVLLHWSRTAAVLTFVEVLPAAGLRRLLVTSGTLFYRSAATPVGADETTLHALTAAAPTTPLAVQAMLGLGQLDPEPLAVDEGLVFLALDEGGVSDFNSDGDMTDAAVLALLDGTDAMGRVLNTSLAMADVLQPVAAHATAAGDWIAAFLVDEQAQGMTNLNDQLLFSDPLLPDPCILVMSDTDADDRILHYLEFQDFAMGMPPVNTGVVGQDRVIAFADVVATLASEADSTCDLNQDGDSLDIVMRYARVATPYVPERRNVLFYAVDTTTPGGAMGLAYLDDRFVMVVDEAQESDVNIDGKVADNSLVAWMDPALANPQWVFRHQSGTRSHGTGVFDSANVSEPYAGASWMAPEPVGGRLGLTFQESVPGSNPLIGSLNTNLDCSVVAKDTDKTDSLPVWCDFEAGPTLDFDGVGYAIDADNAGIVIAAGLVFFRLDEMADNRDYNNDGVADDLVLMRNPLTFCGPVAMATASAVMGPVITTDGDLGAAFLSSEGDAGLDFNGDGDTGDVVVRYFRLR